MDPLEEQLDLPTARVKLRDGKGGQEKVAGQEAQGSVGFGIVKRKATQRIKMALAG